MSGERGRRKAKTDTDEKRKALEEERKNREGGKKSIIGFLSGDADIVTDSTPLIRQLMPRKVALKNFTVNVGNISQPQVSLIVKRSRGNFTEVSEIDLEEGFQQVEAKIDVKAGVVVSVYLSHPGDFRVEDVVFAAEIINL